MTLLSQEKREGKLSECKEKLVKISNIYFERVNEKMSFFHPDMDLSQLDLFKVIKDGQLVDEKDKTPTSTMTPTQEVKASSKKNEGSLALYEG